MLKIKDNNIYLVYIEKTNTNKLKLMMNLDNFLI